MTQLIQVSVSKKELKLTPDIPSDPSHQNEFDVEIKNGSSEFASFYLEITAPGSDPNSNVEWYKIEPEVGAKKPPGDATEFHIVITKAPIPAYDTTVDLTLKAFSVEFPNLYATETLFLKIEKPRIPLKIYLPIKEFKTYPGDAVDIVVFAYNLSPQSTPITLKLLKLEAEWIEGTMAQSFSLDPGENAEKIFRCTPPRSHLTNSQKYDFILEAKTEGQYQIKERGTVEVLPQGDVEISCDRPQQEIPQKRGATQRKRQSNTAIYTLQLTNSSNLAQQVELYFSPEERKKCNLILPPPLILHPGKQVETELIARKKRPWLGTGKKLTFEAKPILTDPNSGQKSQSIQSNPNSKLLELQIRPVVPFPWQLGLGLLALLLLLLGGWRWGLPFQTYHTAAVNSVRFNRDASTIVSGSSDKTLRRWQVDKTKLFQLSRNRPMTRGEKGEENDKAIQVVREQPGQAREQDLFAVGLENGEIQLWDMLSLSERPEARVFLTDEAGNQRSDRLFDLAFGNNFRHLFSTHGSGFLYQWDLSQPDLQPQLIVNAKKTISALAFSRMNLPDNLNAVFLAGRYNQLFLLFVRSNNERDEELERLRIYQILHDPQEENQPLPFKPIRSQESYIETLAVAQNKSEQEILAMADNKGAITLLNSKRLLQCIQEQDSNFGTLSSNIYPNGGIISPLYVKCNPAVLDRWYDGHRGQAIRSVALTSNACYLASAGDDGRVILWPLNSQGKRARAKGIILDRLSDSKFNSVDVKSDNRYIFATSGAEDGQVRLYRRELAKDNAECY
ncbi:MAG: WD40 repeat domain-containing protein [Cyanobacteriota bacterium]|nr:WD40 repeat domain-containing protein [Cyanobacteriota bacterium]